MAYDLPCGHSSASWTWNENPIDGFCGQCSEEINRCDEERKKLWEQRGFAQQLLDDINERWSQSEKAYYAARDKHQANFQLEHPEPSDHESHT